MTIVILSAPDACLGDMCIFNVRWNFEPLAYVTPYHMAQLIQPK